MAAGYDSTMGNPFGIAESGERTRKRLVPGQRMSDGTIYQPPNPTEYLLQEKKRLIALQSRTAKELEDVERKLGPLITEKAIEPVVEADAPKPRSKKTAKATE